MRVQERGLSVPIKQVMVLGIRLPVELPLGPRGGAISLTAAEGPDTAPEGPIEPSMSADPPGPLGPLREGPAS